VKFGTKPATSITNVRQWASFNLKLRVMGLA
jgi:hypothetical protein